MTPSLSHLEDKYEILGRISQRGMGAVYRVRHRLLDEVRAVKILRPDLVTTGALRDRFLYEARTATRLRHPNVVQVHDFSIDEEGAGLIIMEYISGCTLEDLGRRFGTPPIPLAVEVARQSLRALGYLHRRGTVHRDVSPDNLMLTRDVDGEPLIKLIDLGIARNSRDDAVETDGLFIGKVRFASPEHFSDGERGGNPIDERSDLYSLGVVLFQWLTGVCPIEGSSLEDLANGHLYYPHRAFDSVDPAGNVPAELRQLIEQLLIKNPDRRLQTAEEAQALLDELTGRFTHIPLVPLTEELLGPNPRDEPAVELTEVFDRDDSLNGARQREDTLPDPLWPSQIGGCFPETEVTAHQPRTRAPLEGNAHEYLAEAHEALESDELEQAETSIAAALDRAPFDEEAVRLMQEVAVCLHQAELQSAVERSLTAIEGSIMSGELGRAHFQIAAANLRYPDDDRFAFLASYLEHVAAERARQLESRPFELPPSEEPDPASERARELTTTSDSAKPQSKQWAIVGQPVDHQATSGVLGEAPLEASAARATPPVVSERAHPNEPTEISARDPNGGLDDGPIDLEEVELRPLHTTGERLISGFEPADAPATCSLPVTLRDALEEMQRATRPPDPQAIRARRISTLLVDSEKALEAGDLERARGLGHIALSMDETNPAATNLAQRVERALLAAEEERQEALECTIQSVALPQATERGAPEATGAAGSPGELLTTEEKPPPVQQITVSELAAPPQPKQEASSEPAPELQPTAKHRLEDVPTAEVPQARAEENANLDQRRHAIKRALAVGDLLTARAAIDSARREHGPNAFEALEQELEKQTHLERTQAANECIELGRTAMMQARHERAVDAFERAARLAPGNRQALELLSRSRQLLLMDYVESRGQSFLRTIRKIEKLADRGRLDRALDLLRTVEEQDPESNRLRPLRTRLEHQMRVERGAQQRPSGAASRLAAWFRR